MNQNPIHETHNQQIISPGRLNILLMDDNVVNQKLIPKMLKKHGHRVVVAADTKEALNILNIEEIDMFLLDIHMRGKNGFDITKAVRKKEKHLGKHIPIILLSENAMKAQREKSFALGLDELLPKPVFEDELCRVIEKICRSSQNMESVF